MAHSYGDLMVAWALTEPRCGAVRLLPLTAELEAEDIALGFLELEFALFLGQLDSAATMLREEPVDQGEGLLDIPEVPEVWGPGPGARVLP